MAKSFLKWAGGKTRYAKYLASLRPERLKRYLEPFMGSAALFFHVEPEKALLSDSNKDLVVCFQEVRDHPHEVMAILDGMKNTRSYYEEIRGADVAKLSPTERAARVIYLNKTGFRGLWRVNRQGRFNVPYGDYRRPYYNSDTLMTASKLLQNATLQCCDYRKVVQRAKANDWIYLDPPYVPTGVWGDFTRYTPGQFSAHDQEVLAAMVRKLADRGVNVLLTNSDTPEVRRLYKGFSFAVLDTRRDIDLRSKERKSVDLVICNYLTAHQMRHQLKRAS